MRYQIPIVFCAFFSLLSGLTPASAQVQSPMTVPQLQALCSSKYDIDVGMCAGYVTAVAERLMNDSNPHNRVCLSPAIAPETLVTNLEKAWQDQPPQPQDFASVSVESALRQRFRCP